MRIEQQLRIEQQNRFIGGGLDGCLIDLGCAMLDWLLIQTMPAFDNSGTWYARWRWDDCIDCNRAGEREARLTRDEFIRRFLTLPA